MGIRASTRCPMARSRAGTISDCSRPRMRWWARVTSTTMAPRHPVPQQCDRRYGLLQCRQFRLEPNGPSSAAYSVEGTGDFNGDGTSDILFRNDATGDVGFYQMNNGANAGWHEIGFSSTAYSIVGTGDFNGDGTTDILFRNATNGDVGFYQMSNGALQGWHDIGLSSTAYSVATVGDYAATAPLTFCSEMQAPGTWASTR